MWFIESISCDNVSQTLSICRDLTKEACLKWASVYWWQDFLCSCLVALAFGRRHSFKSTIKEGAKYSWAHRWKERRIVWDCSFSFQSLLSTLFLCNQTLAPETELTTIDFWPQLNTTQLQYACFHHYPSSSHYDPDHQGSICTRHGNQQPWSVHVHIFRKRLLSSLGRCHRTLHLYLLNQPHFSNFAVSRVGSLLRFASSNHC